jgi:hypothetical protein
MEVCNKYGDMATWEMKSLSVGDGAFMLGILALAAGKEQFGLPRGDGSQIQNKGSLPTSYHNLRMIQKFYRSSA